MKNKEEKVLSKFEKYVEERGENLASVNFGIGHGLKTSGIHSFFSEGSTLSECSYNTIMQLCRYFNCSPEDLMEQNEINGIYSDVRAIDYFVKTLIPLMEKFERKDYNEYFLALYTRPYLSIIWFFEYPDGRIVFRCAKIRMKGETILYGNCYEAEYDSDIGIENIPNLYITHKKIKFEGWGSDPDSSPKVRRDGNWFKETDNKKLQVIPYDKFTGIFFSLLFSLFKNPRAQKLTHVQFMKELKKTMSSFRQSRGYLKKIVKEGFENAKTE